MTEASASISLVERVTLVSAPQEIWPLLRDTDRINRASGLPPVTYGPPDTRSLVRPARARLFGVWPMTWDEPPFEWVAGRFYAVRRVYHSGPVREVYGGIRWISATELEVFADVRLRGALTRGLALIAARRSLQRFADVVRRLDAAARESPKPPPYRRRREQGRVGHTAQLLVLLARMPGVRGREIGEQLFRQLDGGFDDEVVALRPYELADRWGFERQETLIHFLHATRLGVLDLSWAVLCPHCRVAKAHYESLSGLKSGAHCDTCDLDFEAQWDRSVEARFRPSPTYREAQADTFCIGGPGNTPHRQAQLRLVPGETRVLAIDLPARRLFLRSLTGRTRLALTPDPLAGAESLVVALRGGEPMTQTLAFRPGTVELRLSHDGAEALWLAVDEEGWSDLGATAADVAALPEFRDLFAGEVLAAGEHVAVRNLTVLFTDLKGSTALYERAGDGPAYARVRAHFGILFEAIAAGGGTVVKTIGDAVMATFPSADQGLRAAVDILARLATYNDRNPGQPIIVKLGLHQGPSLAVNLDERLDYFGTTVNLAARVQGESLGDDIVLSEAVYRSQGVAVLMQGLQVEPFEAELRGLAARQRLWRIRRT